MGRSLRIGRFVACQKVFVESRLRVGTKSPLLIGRDNGKRLFDYLLRLVRVSFIVVHPARPETPPNPIAPM
jgi:hypothetical protein